MSSLQPSFLRKIKVIIWPYRWRFLLGGTSILVLNAIDLIPPIVTKTLLQEIQNNQLSYPITFYGFSIFLCYLSISLLRLLWRFLIVLPSRKIEIELRKDIFFKILDSSYQGIKNFKTGDIISIMTQDISTLRMLLGPGIVISFDTIGYLVFIPILLFYLLGFKALFVLSPFSLLLIVAYKLHLKMEKAHLVYSENQSNLSQHIFENISGIRLFRAYHLLSKRKNLHQDIVNNLFKQQLEMSKLDLIIDFTIQIVLTLSYGIVIYLVYQGRENLAMSLGLFIVTVQLLDKLTWPVMSFGHLVTIYQSAKASMLRLSTLKDLPHQKIVNKIIPSRFFPVSIKNLNLIINGKRRLDSITLTIYENEKIGIVGKTGSGKTTLLELISGLFEHEQVSYEEFSLGDKHFYDIAPQWLKNNIHFLPQVPQLLSLSLKKNIIVQHAHEESKIQSVIKHADLASDVERWPLKENTLIGEKGINLSGGQKQRTLIARSLYGGYPFLIWDDPISGLDAKTEKIIIDYVTNLRQSTLIIATHRLSMLKSFDKIIVLNDGKIDEVGTYLDLQKSNIIFQQLLNEEVPNE